MRTDKEENEPTRDQRMAEDLGEPTKTGGQLKEDER
jgi:hypothetical protein